LIERAPARQIFAAERHKKAWIPLQLTDDPIRVQESGLVKDTLVLDIPDEAGNFDSVLVRRARGSR
jgi:hypothetical protein